MATTSLVCRARDGLAKAASLDKTHLRRPPPAAPEPDDVTPRGRMASSLVTSLASGLHRVAHRDGPPAAPVWAAVVTAVAPGGGLASAVVDATAAASRQLIRATDWGWAGRLMLWVR